MDLLVIDGNKGEGGGQILRTSLALACVTGRAVRIENIRARRRNPGLARQHLCCVRAACRICKGRAEGDRLGSGTLDFTPGPARGGSYHFDIGSAGSASLVAQTVLPALFGAERESRVTITGGTHNPWAPPYEFLNETFLPAIKRAGFGARCKLLAHGFYPIGGGRMSFAIERPSPAGIGAIEMCEPPAEPKLRAVVCTAKLHPAIGARQERLLSRSGLEFEEIEHVEIGDSPGPGNCAAIYVSCAAHTTVFTAFGQPGKPSEKVIGELVDMTRAFLCSGAAVDRFLADQLLIYMALAAGGSFTTNELSSHLLTNIEVIKQFLPVDFTTDRQGNVFRVSCHRR